MVRNLFWERRYEAVTGLPMSRQTLNHLHVYPRASASNSSLGKMSPVLVANMLCYSPSSTNILFYSFQTPDTRLIFKTSVCSKD